MYVTTYQSIATRSVKWHRIKGRTDNQSADRKGQGHDEMAHHVGEGQIERSQLLVSVDKVLPATI